MPAVVKTVPGPEFFEVRVSAVRDRVRRFNGWLVIVRDITSRRQAEAERYALERRVQEQQKSESLTVFAAGVAHDFNNLLTGILGNADLLAMQAPPDSTQRRTAEAIVIGSQRAADLVSKMLAYAGEGRVVSERVDLDSLVREMVDVLSASVSKHCTLVYNSPGPLPMVDADPTQIRQVVLNLIINATEAVDEGGLVTVATGQEALDRDMLSRMTFGADVEPGPYVFIDVVDNGLGMSDETMARMFDPFYSTKETGRGLGWPRCAASCAATRRRCASTSAPGTGDAVPRRGCRSCRAGSRVQPRGEIGQPRDARAIRLGVEAGRVVEHRHARARHGGHRPRPRGTRSPTCAVLDASAPDSVSASWNSRRIRLLHAPFVGIEQRVEPAREVEPIEQVTQPPVGVGHHDQAQPALAKRGQRRNHIGLDMFPEVVLGVVVAERIQRAIGFRSERATPTCSRIRLKYIQPRLRSSVAPTIVASSSTRMACGSAAARRPALTSTPALGQRLAHTDPVRVDEDAAGIEKQGFDGHGESDDPSIW